MAVLVILATCIAASANFPVLALSLFWRRFNSGGVIRGMALGLVSSVGLALIGPAYLGASAIWPLVNPTVVALPLGILGAVFGRLLEFALRSVGVEPSVSIVKPLFDKYLDLDPYPEAKDALGKFKSGGAYKLAILSNGSNAMLSALVRNSGLDPYLDATISVDGARKYKPHPHCYALVEKVLGFKNDEVMFVSSNSFDVAGAKHFGFKVAWIQRGGGVSVPKDPVLPAQMYRLLRGNAETLGYVQDFTVSALTDLIGLL